MQDDACKSQRDNLKAALKELEAARVDRGKIGTAMAEVKNGQENPEIKEKEKEANRRVDKAQKAVAEAKRLLAKCEGGDPS